MDSITHIVLGATLGEALAGKALGKRALLLGAAAQSLPDIDFVASFWLPTANNLIAHRGFTHSILCTILLAPLLAMAANRWTPATLMTMTRWMVFFGVQTSLHIFLDGFNSYGVGWFEPFDHTRVSFNTLFVADPFYSTWLGISTLSLLVLKPESPSRKRWVQFGLVLSSLYLLYAITSKITIDRTVREIFHQQSISADRYFTTPTPFNTWLWYVVAADDEGFMIGHRSVFDHGPMDFYHIERKDSLLGSFRDRDDIRLLKRFSEGFYTVERRQDTLRFNDLRFGQIIGWENPEGPFVFHYYVDYRDENMMVIQRGRLAGWNHNTPARLMKRITGR